MNRREFMSVTTAATILGAAGPSAGDRVQEQAPSDEKARTIGGFLTIQSLCTRREIANATTPTSTPATASAA
jgi:hypothetical protein